MRGTTENRSIRRNRFIKPSWTGNPKRSVKFDLLIQIFFVTAALFFVSILLIFIHDIFTQTNYFKIQDVEINDINQLDEEEILKQAKVSKDDNLLDLKLNLIRKRLLAHPWIENVEVLRKMPDRLVINVTEYRPEAIINIEDEFFMLSNKGVLFKPFTDSDPYNLPVITGMSYSDIPVADLSASDQFQAVRTVLGMGRGSEALLPNPEIQKISVDRELGLTVYAFDPLLSIRIGYDHYPEKYENLERIFNYLKNRKSRFQASAIDLSDLDQIVVTPINSKDPHQG